MTALKSSDYTIHKHINVPSDKRLFVIGDTHGRHDLYLKACEYWSITSEDFVVSVGDLIDRGEENLKMVLEFHNKPNRQAILGNHEDMLKLGMFDDNWFGCWLQNGGSTTYKEVGEYGLPLMVDMVKDLPVVLEITHGKRKYAFVHGGVPLRYNGGEYERPTISNLVDRMKVNQQEIFNAVWDRDVIQCAQYDVNRGVESDIPCVDDVDYVFHGHTPVQSIEIYGNRVYLDTGSVFNGKLTMARLTNEGISYYTTSEE